MNDWKWAITSATCCGICLAIAASASADFVGVTIVTKDDPDIEFLCTQGNGDWVPGPLTVCNVFAVFDNPDDILLSVGNAELQVYNGANPDVFFQHPFNFAVTSPLCAAVRAFPDLICDTFITIGLKCAPEPAGTDDTGADADFDAAGFADNGHIVGGWHIHDPDNGQGEAGTWPNLQVLFLQSSVAQGLSLSGDIDIFWKDGETGEVFAEVDLPIECAAGCPDDYPCDDGDACTENDQCIDGVCTGLPIDCDDGNPCTDDDCDPDTGCVNTPNDLNSCDDSDPCNGDESCKGGTCQAGTPLDCDDNNLCTNDDCEPVAGCVNIRIDCDDNDACTEDSCDSDFGCVSTPIDCNDEDACTEDGCDSDTGCTHQDIECPKGQLCEPASGECVEDQDPCECENGRVTLCHVPPGNPGNARTIIVGCAARDRHLAHGDICGPCE